MHRVIIIIISGVLDLVVAPGEESPQYSDQDEEKDYAGGDSYGDEDDYTNSQEI